jgi:hypothetical protein
MEGAALYARDLLGFLIGSFQNILLNSRRVIMLLRRDIQNIRCSGN